MTASLEFLSHLNAQQLFAVTHTEGPMLLLAGAGSGKTRTLTYKIAYVIRQDLCRPERILAVTFTNKAAEEMRGRVEGLLPPLPAAPLIRTFHSLGTRILRRHIQRLGYDGRFNICDVDDQKRILKAVLEELQLSGLEPRKLQAEISWAKNRNWDPERYIKESQNPYAPEIGRVYGAYQRYLRASNALDFDDLLLQTVRLFEEHRDVRESYGDWFRYILIDEYQDTNPPQNDLLKNLACLHQNVTAVGDEDQSIYGFRGADIENILRFEQDFPGTRVVKLEQNYRSTQTILDAATGVVSRNTRRRGKVLWTDRGEGELLEVYVAADAAGEARHVAWKIYEHLQKGESGLAVLYRTNFQSRQFEEALRRLHIPYRVVGGVSFYRRKEVKDALAYLRVVSNPHDNLALLRVINEPSRGVGPATLEKLHALARDLAASLWRALGKGLEEEAFPARARRALQEFQNIVRDSRGLLELPLPNALEKILDVSGYRQALRREGSEEAESRLLNLDELVSAARESASQGLGLQEFLDYAALRSDADDYDQCAPVTLMTLHNAKGLEFPIVFLAGCEEGLFPHARCFTEEELEEERRLCYVGMTRACKGLYLTYSESRRFYGQEGGGASEPSRFLREIPGRLMRIFHHNLGWIGAEGSVKLSARTLRAPTPGPRPRKAFTGRSLNSPESVKAYLAQKASGRPGGKRPKRGTAVQHEEYGRGTVLDVEPSGGDLKVTVQFAGYGIRKFMLGQARLKGLSWNN